MESLWANPLVCVDSPPEMETCCSTGSKGLEGHFVPEKKRDRTSTEAERRTKLQIVGSETLLLIFNQPYK